MKKINLLILSCILSFSSVTADEGMWLPMLVERLNYVDMQKEGLQLTPEELYSINNSSLKDAIVRLGRGFCTGEMISDQGLMLTNHHCGFGAIQSLSTEDKNYLDDGFWAMDRKDEKPAGFPVSFLKRMEDISNQINTELNESMSENERTEKINELSTTIKEIAIGETSLTAEVKSFFNGNEFYLFLYQTFDDVRLVGAPPESIGKFGGDTDNWMWPRHTGDFSLFRVYANNNNEPAPYSEDNIPYKPDHHLPVSLNGVSQGDFTMVFGYPGSTNRYLTSPGIKYELETRQPTYVKLRRLVLDIYEDEMGKDSGVRLKYASKHAGISNYWKYFKGQSEGLKRLKVYERKKSTEDDLEKWISNDAKRQKEYNGVLDGFETGYTNLTDINKIRLYLNEAIFRIEAINYAYNFTGLKRALVEENQEAIKKEQDNLLKSLDGDFKNYDKTIDQRIFTAMIRAYSLDIPKKDQADGFKKLVAKYGNDFEKMATSVYAKTVFSDKEKARKMIEAPSVKKLEKDPIYAILKSVFNHYLENVKPKIEKETESLTRSERLFVKGLREMNSDIVYAPDANSTMRVSYGQVENYFPKDAVTFNNITTANGILQKEDPNNIEFIVPAKLKELIRKKDYGQYADANGELIVNFITNNDITGGNSGSPIINGKGELIGTAFDGNWESMSGDIAFETTLQRTIGVDIRYVLFIIDKFAGASHLVEEMTLVK
ncbi:MAG: hypothetical protein ACI9GZ_000177 [Bacteroidia bacterium]|jgi:hypothetical protein